MKTLLLPLLFACLGAGSAPAVAADNHKGHDHGGKAASHSDQIKPAYGGVVTVVKDINYELVAKSDSLTLYVSDHGKPVDLKGASARLTLLSASDKADVTLGPVGERLEAKGSFKVAPGTKVAGQVTLPGGAPTNVRFTLK
ncbi:hypothetical protein [Aquabacterium sp. J223]|jgi:hypothetical protein|uniref:hypothetical protein n=1 Tax=Aquabacterium sp. J223 TaxID=2898431 RepID=UPI0021AD8F62|nr:hypothetical protein [Aquabacterium sp. J223]UUX96653.1 hypothetical protein LRS07_04980 [Aquabacterium sp. J223]